MKKVVIIGGGVIGLCSAYYLIKEGHEVTVVDQSSMDFGASYVNAGYLTPSHFIPLAAPGVVKQGLKWMFNSASPLYIQPRINRAFLEWAWAFNKSCSTENVSKSSKVIKDINLFSVDLFSDIKSSENFSFHLENKGLLILCQTESMFKEELEISKIGIEEGLDVKELSSSELKGLEPKLAMNVEGAIHYKCDWHTTPHEFMSEMYQWLEANGVIFHKNEEVRTLDFSNEKIQEIVTESKRFSADEFVLSAGTWSSLLTKKLGLKIKLEAGKGYRINTNRETNITMPAILAEAKVAVTPMNGFTRFAGTMEFSGINHHVNPVRVEAIAQAVNKYYPDVHISDAEKLQAASGLRPVSPDGKPYIGKSSKCENLTIATGHAMMGWSMAPATGKLVSEIISDKKSSLNLMPFSPDRKF